jgi:hypothetical protein
MIYDQASPGSASSLPCNAQLAALRVAIGGLYESFAGYPLREKITFCPCCGTEEEEASLHSAPLNELSMATIAPYARGASWATWGKLQDFKHFVPRLLELIVFNRPPFGIWPELEFLFRRLRCFDGLKDPPWEEWPATERSAIDVFLRAWWRFVLAHHDPTNSMVFVPTDDPQCPVEHYVHGPQLALTWIAYAAKDIAPYAAILVEDGDTTPLKNLIDLIDHFSDSLNLDTERAAQAIQIRQGLTSAASVERLQESASNSTETDLREVAAAALGQLGALRQLIIDGGRISRIRLDAGGAAPGSGR